MTKVVFAASLAVAVLTGCAVVPYGPGPVAGVEIYAAPAPAIYGYPYRYGYYGHPGYGRPGYYRPYRW